MSDHRGAGRTGDVAGVVLRSVVNDDDQINSRDCARGTNRRSNTLGLIFGRNYYCNTIATHE